MKELDEIESSDEEQKTSTTTYAEVVKTKKVLPIVIIEDSHQREKLMRKLDEQDIKFKKSASIEIKIVPESSVHCNKARKLMF